MEIQLQNHYRCFICGNDSCQENYDHCKITIRQFDCLLATSFESTADLPLVHNSIIQLYQCLQHSHPPSYSVMLSNNMHYLLRLTNKLNYWYLLKKLSSLRDIEDVLLGNLIPKHRLINLVNSLRKYGSLKELQFKGWAELQSYLDNCTNHTITNTQDCILEGILSIISHHERADREKLRNTCNAAKIQCKQQSQNIMVIQDNKNIYAIEHYTPQIVTIENVPISTTRKSLQLSMLEVTDELLLSYILAIDKVSLEEINLRNNRLTYFGNRILYNSLPNLKVLDIRNTDIQYLLPSLHRINHLQTLYICECGVDDHELIYISTYLSRLSKLFCNRNEVSFMGANIVISNLQSLVYLSLSENKITAEEGIILQHILLDRNGYCQM